MPMMLFFQMFPSSPVSSALSPLHPLAPPVAAPLLHSAYCVLIAVWYCFAVYAKPLDGP